MNSSKTSLAMRPKIAPGQGIADLPEKSVDQEKEKEMTKKEDAEEIAAKLKTKQETLKWKMEERKYRVKKKHLVAKALKKKRQEEQKAERIAAREGFEE